MGRSINNFSVALSELAAEEHILTEMQRIVEDLQPAFELEEVNAFLGNVRVPKQQKCVFLQKLTEIEFPQIFLNFLNLMFDRNYGEHFAETFAEVHDKIIEAQGIEIATLCTAKELSSEQQAEFRQRLEQVWGHAVYLKHQLNPKLLGGAVLYRNDQVYDGSLFSRLDEMRSKLLQKNLS